MLINHFSEYISAHRRKYGVVLILMVLEATVSLAIPFFIGQFSSAVMDETTVLDLDYNLLVAVWIMLIVAQAFLRYQSSFRVNMIGASILSQLSCRLYDHVQMLPVSYFSQRKKGEILSLISNDANVMAFFLSGILANLVPSLLVGVGALTLMASINLKLALIIAVTIPAFFLLLKLLSRKVRPLSEMATQQQADIVAHAAENFGAIQLLKSFGREQIESDKFKSNTQQMLKLRRIQFHIQALLSPIIQMLISIGVVLLVVISVTHYQSGELTVPQLITLLIYGLLFAKPMSSLAASYGQYQQAVGASTRIVNVFNVAPEADNHSERELNFSKGNIKISNVSYYYDEAEPLLNNINAEFEGNSVSVILGDNGSGKTTLLHLLMRFIKPLNGTISIDDQDIQQCSIYSLRSHIALVSQDVALSHGSIYENIAYGRPETSKEEVVDAAERAGAARFIRTLDKMYDSHVGDNGILLSAGQRQKIALARALLRNCKVIIFDEPTSYADGQGREAFFSLISEQLSNHTVIVVTHDKALAEVADTVYNISNSELNRISK